MVLDTSAIIAIVLKEPGFEELLKKIETADALAIGAPTLLEAAMVLSSRKAPDPRVILATILRKMNVHVVPFSAEHFDSAAEAFLRFGKRRHPAALNYGDCMSYAVAAVAGMPLLYTGNDFARTDIRAA